LIRPYPDARVKALGRTAVRPGWLLALALAVGLAGVGRAHAHALLLRSSPEADAELTQPPAAIDLWFSEPLEPGFSRARLIGPAGQAIAAGPVRFDPADPAHMTLPLGALEPGLYTVAWETLSQVDGHPSQGSFPITVLNPDGSRPTGAAATPGEAGRGELPTLAETAARWLSLMGAALCLGAPLFQRVVVIGARRPGAGDAVETRGAELAGRAFWLGGLAIIVGAWLPVGLTAIRLGELARLPELATGTRPAVLALARQALVVSGLLVLLTSRPRAGRGPLILAVAYLTGLIVALRGEVLLLAFTLGFSGLGLAWGLGRGAFGARHRGWEALILLAAPALFSFSASSHAAAAPGSAWAILGDYLHLLAASAWVGGLLLLPWLMWLTRRTRAGSAPQLGPLVRRFSHLAGFAVFLLAFTGLFNSLVEFPDLESVVNTTYGRVLLIKLALTAAALGLACLNNRLVRGWAPQDGEADRARTLNRRAAVEAALTLGVMISVAVLVQTPAPRAVTPPSQTTLPFNTIARADDLYIHVQVTPNQVGRNRFWLYLYHETGAPIGEVQLVRLLFDYPAAGLGQSSADLRPLGGGAYDVEGAYLTQAGLWDLSIYVRRRGLDDALTQVRLEVPPPARLAAGSPWQAPVPTLPATLLIALGLAAAGLIPLAWRRPLEALAPRLLPGLQVTGAVMLLAAFVFLVLALAALPAYLQPAPGELKNPVPATAESLAQGEALYQENCLPCHGVRGLGDGPLAPTLRPPPANLQVHMVPGVHSDAQVFTWITDGFPTARMPAFGEALSETERWHIVNFIRTLTPGN